MSFFRYAGGKSKLRRHIINSLLPKCGSSLEYREPFFGGGSIGLNVIAKGKAKNVWLNDKDAGIACLWTSVIRHPKELQSRISQFKPCVADFYIFKNELLGIGDVEDSDIVDIGFKKLAIHQISYSGLGTKAGGPLGGKGQESKYKIDCRWSPAYMCKQVSLISELLNTVNVFEKRCTCLDFEKLLSPDSVTYLDPPYYVKGNELYQFGFDQNDHERLATALKTQKNWVLSYDDCPEIRHLYAWAKVSEIDVKYTITGTKEKGTGKVSSRTKPELLIESAEDCD